MSKNGDSGTTHAEWKIRRLNLERSIEDIIILMMKEKTGDGFAIHVPFLDKLIDEFNGILTIIGEAHRDYDNGKNKYRLIPGQNMEGGE